MPIAYSIDPVRSQVVTRGTGIVTVRDVRDFRRALLADPAFAPTLSQLVDYVDVHHFAMSVRDLRTLAADDPFSPSARRAVAAGMDAAFGMVQAYHAIANAPEGHMAAFRSLPQARRWLGFGFARRYPVAGIGAVGLGLLGLG